LDGFLFITLVLVEPGQKLLRLSLRLSLNAKQQSIVVDELRFTLRSVMVTRTQTSWLVLLLLLFCLRQELLLMQMTMGCL
jgi:hypothetical protein